MKYVPEAQNEEIHISSLTCAQNSSLVSAFPAEGRRGSDLDECLPEELSHNSQAGVSKLFFPSLCSFLYLSSFFPPLQIRGLQDKVTFIERVLCIRHNSFHILTYLIFTTQPPYGVDEHSYYRHCTVEETGTESPSYLSEFTKWRNQALNPGIWPEVKVLGH